MKISKEFKIGFFFVLTIAIMIWGFNFLKGKNIFSKDRTLYAVYQEIGGLEKANPVLINGMKVGRVGELSFTPDYSGKIVVVLTLTTDFPIPSNTVAKIFSSDLLGSKAVELVLGDSEELISSGDTIMTDLEQSLSEAVNAQIAPLKRKAENLISSIDTMVVAIQGVFNKDIRAELLSSIQSIRATFQNLENTTSNIDTLVSNQASRIASILYNLDMLTATLEDNRDEIDNVFSNLSSVTDSLAQANIPETFINLNQTVNDLNTIVAKIESGEGTLGKLVNDDTIYTDLEKTVTELNMLLEDIRVNPKRYLRFSVF